MNLKQILENAVARFAAKDAVVMGDRRVSFRQLDEDSNRVARALIGMGVRKGDRVAMLQASNPEFIAVFFGIIKAGAIACPLDSRYIADELERIFADCKPRVLAVEDPPLAAIGPALARFKSISHVITFAEKPGDKYTDYNQIIASSPASPVDVPIDPDDIAIISYTGGPTQHPHGVALCHRAVITEAIDSARVFAQTAEDVMMQFALPMYHQFGLTAVLLASIHTGNTVIVVPGTGRSIGSFMETVESKRGTIYMGVPYIYSLMINVARHEGIRHDISSLRLCVSGGAPLEPVVVRLFKEYYGLNIIDVYGQTETVCHITCAPIDGSGPPGSSGRPLPCWEIKIFDANDNELPPGEEGEIVTRGPVMTRFYNQPEATARIMRNGWLHTGDIGRRDEDGFLYITARQRRMLILKGQNIFPDDIEEVLLAHPRIADARVMGVIDIVRGETVRALVKLKPGEKVTEAEIRQYCQGRLADYKLPREVVFVDVMPEAVPLWRRSPGLEAADISLEGGA